MKFNKEEAESLYQRIALEALLKTSIEVSKQEPTKETKEKLTIHHREALVRENWKKLKKLN
jgi:hypothetical protein